VTIAERWAHALPTWHLWGLAGLLIGFGGWIDPLILCYVAAGGTGQSSFNLMDVVVLTEGEKGGVVEGQVFQLREKNETGLFEKPVHMPRGKVQVFYTGSYYSMAQVLNNDEPIGIGFEAWYKP